MIGKMLLVLLMLSGSSAAFAKPPPEIEALVLDCHDGDTCRMEIETWFDVFVRPSVRLIGIDTPELVSHCIDSQARAEEHRLAVGARDALRELLVGQVVSLTDIKPDKYAGRVAARVWIGKRDVAVIMLIQGHGRLYDGGPRLSWCSD